eukprot:6243308-Pyramimonas_sp.AAC.2
MLPPTQRHVGPPGVHLHREFACEPAGVAATWRSPTRRRRTDVAPLPRGGRLHSLHVSDNELDVCSSPPLPREGAQHLAWPAALTPTANS